MGRNEFVGCFEIHGDQAVPAHIREVLERRLLYFAQLRRHDHVVLFRLRWNAHDGRDPLLLVELQQLHNRLALGLARFIRDFVSLHLEAAPAVGKEDQPLVCVRDHEMAYGVVLARLHADDADTAATLSAIRVQTAGA